MSNTVDALFVTKWVEEAKHEYQQLESRLRDSVTVYTGVGSDFSVPRMESVSATRNKPRHADLIPANVASDRVPLTIATIHASELIDDLDIVRTNTELRMNYTKALVGAVNRDLDDLIISALNAGGTAVSMSNAYNAAGIIAANKALTVSEVPFENRFSVISPGAMEDMLADNKITSRDYATTEGYSKGFIKGVLGFDHIISNRLPVPTASQRRCFFYHRDSVALGIAKDLTVNVAFVDIKDAWLVTVKMAAGAVIVRDEAVKYADIAD